MLSLSLLALPVGPVHWRHQMDYPQSSSLLAQHSSPQTHRRLSPQQRYENQHSSTDPGWSRGQSGTFLQPEPLWRREHFISFEQFFPYKWNLWISSISEEFQSKTCLWDIGLQYATWSILITQKSLVLWSILWSSKYCISGAFPSVQFKFSPLLYFGFLFFQLNLNFPF